MTSNHKVFVIGELNVDLIMTGDQVVPEWNREKLVDSFDMVLGSSSAITASGLSGLGMDVYFVSVVGDDAFGHFCIQELQKKGIDTQYVKVDPALKTGVTLSLSTSKDRALLTYMGAISKVSPEILPKEIMQLATHIHFGSFYLQEDMMNHWHELFKTAKDYGISTSFDTGWDPNERWNKEKVLSLTEYTDLFLPSEEEIKHIIDRADLAQLTQLLPEKHGRVAVKLGSKGSLLIDEDGSEIMAPSFSITPIDTTGAGDSFNAGLIFGYLNGQDDKEMLQFANACGAIATLRIGGASSVPAVSDVKDFLNHHLNTKSK
jgi:sugar/nucleoside kinase (ribokinase family)